MYEADQTTLEMANFPIEGNIIDHSWPFIITLENEKPDHLAISLLAHIVYWYRPSFDPITKKIGKKYKADILQRSYVEIEDMLGLTKKEAQEAFKRLESLDICYRELRTIEINGQKVSNVLFIRFNPKKLTELRENFFKKSISSSAESNKGVRRKSLASPPKVMTYTYSTTETSQENTTTQAIAVFPFLKDIGLNDEQQIQLSKEFSAKEEDLRRAVQYSTSPSVTIKTTLIQTIRWAAKAKPELPEVKENKEKNNKTSAISLLKKIASQPEYIYIECLSEGVEVGCKTSQKQPTLISYNENGFIDQFRNLLLKNNVTFKVEK